MAIYCGITIKGAQPMSGLQLKGLKGLRGLDSLLHESKNEAPTGSIGDLVRLSANMLVAGKYQPRTEFDTSALEQLADSIKANGIIQPLIVRKVDEKNYEIIAGERRWRAAKMAGLKDVPVIIRDVPDDTASAFALIENIQRENLNPIDEAIALKRLKEEFSMTHEQISEAVGYTRSRSTVTNLLRILTLSSEAQDLLRQKKIDIGHAKTLLTLDDHSQSLVVKQIVEKGLSVRESELLVQKLKKASVDKADKNDFAIEERGSEWQEILQQKLKLPIKVILNNKGKGKVIILVESTEEMEWIVSGFK